MGAATDLIIEPRIHDLGGAPIRRVLPYHKKRAVGPFVFFDHIGPADVPPGRGAAVRPHPHIGLATVTYLFEGSMDHRDTLGTIQTIEPRAVNWMTAGRGISHSERAPKDLLESGHRMHGIQTWVALPKPHEEDEPAFVHHPADTLPRFDLGGAEATLIAGEAWGHVSPVEFPWPIWYLAVEAPNGAAFDLPLEVEERSVYVVKGEAEVDGERLSEGKMSVLKLGEAASVTAQPDTILMLSGGAPLDGPRYIEWNFVSSSKERLEQAKEDWRKSIARNWVDTPFTQPPGETAYIPLPGDPEPTPLDSPPE